MIENSKGKTVNPAVVEHMAMENERLRGLLRRIYNYVPIPDQIRIDAALSQQAEPVECPVCCSDEPHTGTCGSSDPRALCNRAKAEPAGAQDEREAFEAWMREEYAADEDMLKKPHEGHYFYAKPANMWSAWQARATRPAQAEQQPMPVLDGWRIERSGDRIIVQQMTLGAGYAAARTGDSGIAESVLYLLAETLLAAPIAQTAQGDDQ